MVKSRKLLAVLVLAGIFALNLGASGACPIGDIDGDCFVGMSDLKILCQQWLVYPAGTADLNGDNDVNIEDFALLAANWLVLEETGSVQVTIEPAGARSAGAQWRIDSGPWHNSGQIENYVSTGSHTVEFSTIAGWDTPANQPIYVNYGQTTVTSGEYIEQVAATMVINEFMALNASVLGITTDIYELDESPDWIELHNLDSGDSIDLGGWYLTDDSGRRTKWQFPSGVSIAPNGYLIVFASDKKQEEYPTNYPYVDLNGALHTNFALSSNGEYLALVRPNGVTIEHEYLSYPKQRGLVSYGIASNDEVGYLLSPTPGTVVSGRWTGAANTAKYTDVVADTKFSVNRGFYDSPFDLIISCSTPGASIYYTDDFTEPIDNSGSPTGTATLYTGPISGINTTTCIRAAAVRSGWLQTNVDTQTYFFLDDVVAFSQSQALNAGYPSTWWNGKTADYEMDQNPSDLADIAGNSGYTLTQARTVIKNALLTIPTLSLVTDKDNLFSDEIDPDTGGIYYYTGYWDDGTGADWERPISAEYFDVNGIVSEFQISCGLRIQGGESRSPDKAPKHSLSLRFRGNYGPGVLEYDMFPGSPVKRFNSLHLRAMYNNSWIHFNDAQREAASMIRDQWMRDALINMGQSSAGYGGYVHLYLNGIYWGVYNIHERPEASHYGEHNSVDSDTLDAINSLEYDNGPANAVDGYKDSWEDLWTQVDDATSGGISLTEYQDICEKLNVTNLCDYMIVNHYAGNVDWTYKNWRSAGGGINDALWEAYSWDGERVLESVTENVIGTNFSKCPSGMFHALRDSAEFNMLFADRVHKHFHNNGALSPAQAAATWMNRANELDAAIIAESARWGDYRRDVHSWLNPPYELYTRNGFWIPEQSRLINDYFPDRTNNMQVQYESASPKLYPATDAPNFYIEGSPQYGGAVNQGDDLTMTKNSSGTIYYTLDGSDPRLSGDSAVGTTTTLVSENASKRVTVPTGSISSWNTLGFSDSGWTLGTGGVGYERSPGDPVNYESLINIDVESDMYDENSTCYIRIPFNVDGGDLPSYTSMSLNVRYDDGFIAYINGVPVAEYYAPGTPQWDSTSTNQRSDSECVNLVAFNISGYIGDLQAGSNMLAIQGLNVSNTSSDFLISAELEVTAGGGSPGDVSPTASAYTGPITLNYSTEVKARVLDSSEWSALSEAVFGTGPLVEKLRITEIMYHPADPPSGPYTDEDFEFIEIKHIGLPPEAAINLNLVSFVRGIEYTFNSPLVLEPNEYVVLVKNQAAFASRYDTGGIDIAPGEYIGSLDNSGEKLELVDALGNEILDPKYNDGWYEITDGLGFSLTIRNPNSSDPNDWDSKEGWRASFANGGSPGEDDSGFVLPADAVIINELLAHADTEPTDWIEFYNATGAPINIGGWFISDSDLDLMKYEIEENHIVPVGGYAVFYQDTNFGPGSSDPGSHTGFALSENGEKVFLTSGSGGVITGVYSTERRFGPSEKDIAFGHYVKSTGGDDFVAMSSNTPNAANAYPKVDRVVINEISYHPDTNGDAEFVELLNISGSAITLYDSVKGVPWRFVDDPDDPGLAYSFPAAPSAITLANGEYLLLVKDKSAFETVFLGGSNISTLGVQWLEWGIGGGSLNNGGEKPEIQMPGDLVATERMYIRVDRITYSDGSHPVGTDPWPIVPDGSDTHTLQRKYSTQYGNDVANWQSAEDTPGAANPSP